VQNNSTSLAFITSGGVPVTDGSGNNILTSPIISDRTKDGRLYGLYLQDEWKLADNLTMNYGARFDDMEQFVSANQLSPRVGLVYKPTDTTTLHAGYARYFTPPPIQLVSNGDLNAFANTTNAATVPLNNPVQPERSHNFDVGATQKLGDRWQVGIDGYYKLDHDLLDEGQFGQALILTPFNYQSGYVYGSELTATYTGDKLKAYGNLAFSRAMGQNVVSSQFKFTDPTEFNYISNHYVHLDHDQTWTASAGATYDVRDGTTLGLDGIYGSGLRQGFANTSHLPAYVTFNASIEQKLDLIPHNETAVRLSVINLFDSVYELRDGSGIGVGAPQWGARRGIFAALIQKF
jgi:outer membrane receptor protein involved in Fe transport